MDYRTKLLGCALQLFAQRGFDGVGVQEIAAAAGATKPTLYHYFGSKVGLLEALLDERSGPLEETLRAAADYRGDLPRTLAAIVACYAAFAAAEPQLYRLELGLYFAPPKSDAYRVATSRYRRRHALIEAAFAAAAKDHGNMRGRHRRYAVTLVGMINSYVSLQLDGYLKMNDQVRHELVRQFSHGIYS